ncbi:MAG: hypothetical protein E7302_04330 [Butyrivibrio sp.]|jgi:hypothetical protein|nr:hypothetical protein [Butyrivibrio sp.]
MANTSEQRVDTPNGGKVGIIIGIVVIILLLVIVIILLLTRGSSAVKEEVQEEKRSVVVTEENAGDVIKDMVETKDEEAAPETSYYSATMNYEWRFPTGDAASSNAYVENNTDNSTAVYFDVVLADDENEVIYNSPVIPVGSSLSGFSLTKKLEAGSYDCICIYHLVDDDQNTLSTLRVKVKVIVEQ